jgi:hypothetical protein
MRNPSASAWWVTGAVTTAIGGGLFAPLGASGCSSTPRPAFAVDCSAMNQYEFSIYDAVNPLGEIYSSQQPTWFAFGDSTPGAVPAGTDAGDAGDGAPPTSVPPATMPIPGGLCADTNAGATYALVLQSSGHNDYGSGFGDYAFANGFGSGGFSPGGMCGADGGPVSPAQYIDASSYDGLSFWARNPGETTKGIILQLTDIHSARVTCPTTGQCVPYGSDAGVNTYVTMGSNGTLPPGSSVASAQPPADACDNNFSVAVLTSANWQLYTVPFSSFYQAFQPNRIPSGLDTAHVALFTIRVPKEGVVELWIANLGFYRKKGPDSGP